MRKLLSTLVLSSSLISTASFADQKTLQAFEKAGVTLTDEQRSSLESAQCNASDCKTLTDQIAALVSAYAADDAKVEAILKAASEAHPQQATQFGEAAIEAAPEAAAVIAQVMTETSATAAGPADAATRGLNIARSVANINNNIPTPPGGGGTSSPN